mgnify:CR=1 FL=1
MKFVRNRRKPTQVRDAARSTPERSGFRHFYTGTLRKNEDVYFRFVPPKIVLPAWIRHVSVQTHAQKHWFWSSVPSCCVIWQYFEFDQNRCCATRIRGWNMTPDTPHPLRRTARSNTRHTLPTSSPHTLMGFPDGRPWPPPTGFCHTPPHHPRRQEEPRRRGCWQAEPGTGMAGRQSQGSGWLAGRGRDRCGWQAEPRTGMPGRTRGRGGSVDEPGT